MKRMLVPSVVLVLLAGSIPALAAENWSIDPVHSTAQFTAKHFGIVPVVGTIPIVGGSVQLNAGSQIPTSVSAELDASKVDTHNDQRDADLRSDHYFDVKSTPTIKFVSTKIDGTNPDHFTIIGDLTMHGATHAVLLNAKVVGSGKSPRGESLIAYAATATVDRTEWGMSYGPLIVGNSVDLSLNVEAAAP
ncbi:MAG TPA: YceI family protein [Candidatus Nitrosotalea sp.]|nr:YceI family protein [Candidatus Nitrosotalea sp.]